MRLLALRPYVECSGAPSLRASRSVCRGTLGFYTPDKGVKGLVLQLSGPEPVTPGYLVHLPQCAVQVVFCLCCDLSHGGWCHASSPSDRVLLPQDSWRPCKWSLSADPALPAEGLGRPCAASLLSLWGCGGAACPWLEGEDPGLSHRAIRAPICS